MDVSEQLDQYVKEFDSYLSKLKEFYEPKELDSFCKEAIYLAYFISKTNIMREVFAQYGLKLTDNRIRLLIGLKVNEKLAYVYQKNLEAIKYGFENVKIPLPSITREELVDTIDKHISNNNG